MGSSRERRSRWRDALAQPAPHVLTPGMRRAQLALSLFQPLIDWTSFRRRNITPAVESSSSDVAAFACGDGSQAILWLLATGPLRSDERLAPRPPQLVKLSIPGLQKGTFQLSLYDTVEGRVTHRFSGYSDGSRLRTSVRLRHDLAVAVRPSCD